MNPRLTELRFNNGVKEVELKIGGKNIRILIVNGLNGFEKVAQGLINGSLQAHFVEVMACQGGCVNGGGQPFNLSEKGMKLRTKSVYDMDEIDQVKVAHRNQFSINFYEKHLEKPGSEKSINLLHTRYSKRTGLM